MTTIFELYKSNGGSLFSADQDQQLLAPPFRVKRSQLSMATLLVGRTWGWVTIDELVFTNAVQGYIEDAQERFVKANETFNSGEGKDSTVTTVNAQTTVVKRGGGTTTVTNEEPQTKVIRQNDTYFDPQLQATIEPTTVDTTTNPQKQSTTTTTTPVIEDQTIKPETVTTTSKTSPWVELDNAEARSKYVENWLIDCLMYAMEVSRCL